MTEQQVSLTEENLATLFCEVEAIMNSRPLTPVSDDPTDLEALTPNHLLLLRPGLSFPPGLFDSSDLYARRRWRQVQYLVDLFWKRWRQEYLSSLQVRSKWTSEKRNLQVGDLVLVVDQVNPRSQWPLARVTRADPDDHGHVRKVEVRTASSTMSRPISKIVLLRSIDRFNDDN